MDNLAIKVFSDMLSSSRIVTGRAAESVARINGREQKDSTVGKFLGRIDHWDAKMVRPATEVQRYSGRNVGSSMQDTTELLHLPQISG